MKTQISLLTLTMGLGACGAPGAESDVQSTLRSRSQGSLLAATFGANDFQGLGPCSGVNGIDGLPVVFDRPLDLNDVQPEDFVVITTSGEAVTPLCATFFPSVDADERRTILTQGIYGDPDASPLEVQIVDSIRSADGQTNYMGERIDVIPFEVGQHLVYARALTGRGSVGGADECPRGTAQVIQLAMGSNAGNNFPEEDLDNFRVFTTDGVVNPVSFADTTVDNYLELCLDTASPASSVEIDPLTVTDASGQLNQVLLSAPLE